MPAADLPTPHPDPLPKILPFGGISLLAGAPNVGKTMLLASLVRDLRDRRPIFGHTPPALPGIGFVNADRSWAKGAGYCFNLVGYSDIPQYTMADDDGFDPRRLRKRVDRPDILFGFIDKLALPPGSLIIVDPIALFLGGNLLNYDDCAVACHEIRKYLKKRHYTIWATAHSAKIKADKSERYARLQDQILGSTALLGFTDTQMYLAGPAETAKPYHAFLWHPHTAKAEIFYLEQDDEGLFRPYSGADNENQRKVLRLFPQPPATIKLEELVDAAQQYPLSRSTVQRTVDVLLERGLVERPHHGAYRLVSIN